MATKVEALMSIYNTLNRPSKAGPKWVTYRRETLMALTDFVKSLAIAEGVKWIEPPINPPEIIND